MHANSPAEVPARLEALAALGGLDRLALHSQLAAAVKVVLHMRRGPGGERHLAEIGVFERRQDTLLVRTAWRRDEGWHPAGAELRRSASADLRSAAGAEPQRSAGADLRRSAGAP